MQFHFRIISLTTLAEYIISLFYRSTLFLRIAAKRVAFYVSNLFYTTNISNIRAYILIFGHCFRTYCSLFVFVSLSCYHDSVLYLITND